MIKELKQQLVKDAIVAETKKQFLEKGIRKTTLRGIAKELGIAFGNIYYYFKSKIDICDILWVGYTNDFIDNFEKEIKSAGLAQKKGLDKLRHYYSTLFDYFQENPLYAHLISFSMAEKPRYLRAPVEIRNASRETTSRIKETLVEVYREGIADGSIKAEIPNLWHEAWSFNISYVAITINIIRYHEISEDIYDYYVDTYMNRLGVEGGKNAS